jgi:hypothetical protein
MIERRRVAPGVYAYALVIAGCIAATPLPASAQANSGRIAFNMGLDTSHAYFFRGIRQERDGVIAQPYFDTTVMLLDGGDGLNSIAFTVGQWNSFHSSGRGTTTGPHTWYESDFFTGFTLGLENWEAGVSYTAYMSPSHSFGTVQEIGISLSLDDTGVTMLPLLLHPHLALAVEVHGQADGGASEGAYFELGIEPGLDLAEGSLSLTVPLTLGMSLNNYYEDGGLTNDTFGYLDLGLVLGVPLNVPESFGSWELTGGAHMLLLGRYLESLNGGNQFQAIGSVGLSIGY